MGSEQICDFTLESSGTVWVEIVTTTERRSKKEGSSVCEVYILELGVRKNFLYFVSPERVVENLCLGFISVFYLFTEIVLMYRLGIQLVYTSPGNVHNRFWNTP